MLSYHRRMFVFDHWCNMVSLDAVAPVHPVEDRLEVGAGARDEDADPHASSSFGKRPPVERSVPASSSASTRASTASAVMCDHAP